MILIFYTNSIDIALVPNKKNSLSQSRLFNFMQGNARFFRKYNLI